MTLLECIELHRAAERHRVPGTKINVIRVVAVSARRWRSMATAANNRYLALRPELEGGEARRCRQAADTSELLGVPVGLVIETAERVL